MKQEKNIVTRRPWEPMSLTPVGDLGAVIQDMTGSFSDGSSMGGQMKDKA